MLLTVCLLAVPASLDAAREQQAAARAVALEKAAKTYYTQQGEWPKNLVVLAPLVIDGQDGLKDPWGTPYQYILVRDEKAKVSPFVPYIWTEREVEGVIRVYGKKPPKSQP
jgi:type II secretory pathway pseudopilin PulG